MTDRRTVLKAAALAGALPLLAFAQSKSPRIGFLVSQAREQVPESRFKAFIDGLHEAGYNENRNVTIEYRYAKGSAERLHDLALELERMKVDVIVASDATTVRAARLVTANIPIVMTQSPDPAESGLVASLARPGGNVTGMSFMSPEVAGKSLEILKEIVPKATNLAVLSFRRPQPETDRWDDTVASSALRLGLKPVLFKCNDDAEVSTALKSIAGGRFNTLITRPAPVFLRNRAMLTRFAVEHRLAAVWSSSAFADAGGLISYGANFEEMWHRAAGYVTKILKGAKPADLPVEQPTKFELILNLKTARALGIRIPQTILVRADRVIE